MNFIIQIAISIAMIIMAFADIQAPKIVLAIFAVCNIITAICIITSVRSSQKNK